MNRIRSRTPVLAGVLAVTVAGALLLTACSSGPSGEAGGVPTTRSPSSDAAGTLGAGFVDPSSPPSPEATISPAPGSWDGTHPPADYDVVLLSPGEYGAGDDAQTATLASAVRSWATAEGVTVTDVQPASADGMTDAVLQAVADRADLVISVRNAMVDPVAAISPSALHQQFLVLGAEIAEPTSNVTAADWTGAGFRGEELGASSHHDPSTFTPERAGRALRAGVAALQHDLNGTVVWVD
ncbi:hypothetical protein JOE58_002693 [Curtobacterium luteum]|uniref:BMP family ABC transporter substrate-binding protein n=1 Tax=Curtobacterium luteum TaxID=33881 RepID=A0A8H9GCD1_9MICO|nr:hypothetical protein [Curtobacterium luteum]MBM7803442.1 hypothetical protein [Curtobacterium luteum]GGL11008.1 hypothetical protein GCM10009769_31330 [Curtobacterium luteum]